MYTIYFIFYCISTIKIYLCICGKCKWINLVFKHGHEHSYYTVNTHYKHKNKHTHTQHLHASAIGLIWMKYDQKIIYNISLCFCNIVITCSKNSTVFNNCMR